jgi:hypothetical protein
VSRANQGACSFITALLTKMQYRTRCIRADTPAGDRSLVISEFNKNTLTIDVLVTSMSLSSYGVSLHRGCYRGIILEYPGTANAVWQAVYRLIRPGQTHRVLWRIFKVGMTYHDLQELDMVGGHAPQVVLQGKVPAWVDDDDLKDIVAWDLMRDAWGLPYNLIQFKHDPPHSVRDFYTGAQDVVGA